MTAFHRLFRVSFRPYLVEGFEVGPGLPVREVCSRLKR
jgi:hypothetical protein